MDRNFDELADRFQQNIYESPKGAIRLAILWEDLIETIPGLSGSHPATEAGRPLRILDAGVGMGQMAVRLAREGHELVLCDISEKMLEQAKQRLAEQVPEAKVEFLHKPIQEMSVEDTEPFDVVLFHAVLEWVSEPRKTLQHVSRLVMPGGHLSLMFYNLHSVVLRNVLRGNFRKAKSGEFRGDPKSLTPTHPLDPEEVYQWLKENRISILLQSGIRMFYDYLAKDLREQRSLEDLIEIEQMFSRKEPYRSMARYIHVIGRHVV